MVPSAWTSRWDSRELQSPVLRLCGRKPLSSTYPTKPQIRESPTTNAKQHNLDGLVQLPCLQSEARVRGLPRPRAAAGFFNSSTADIVGWIILQAGMGGCGMHNRIFTSIPGLFPLEAKGIPPVVTIKNVSYVMAKCPLGDKSAPC